MFPLPIISNTNILPPPAPEIEGIFTLSTTASPPRWAFGFCADQNTGMMYCLHGYNHLGAGYISAFTRFNPSTNTTTELSITGIPVNYGYTMQFFNGKIYANIGSSTIYVYDVQTDTWSNKVMQGWPGNKGIYMHSAITDDGIMYLSGGLVGGSTWSNRFYAYDIDSNTVTEKAAVPSGNSSTYMPMCDTCSDGVHVYSASQSGTYKYTPSTNTWEKIGTRAVIGRMCFVNDKLYMQIVDGVVGAQFVEFDFFTGDWYKKGTTGQYRTMGALLAPSRTSTAVYSLFGGTSLNGNQTNTIYMID